MAIILDNYPLPSTLQGVGLGDRKNPRIIVGENYCHFGASYFFKMERGEMPAIRTLAAVH